MAAQDCFQKMDPQKERTEENGVSEDKIDAWLFKRRRSRDAGGGSDAADAGRYLRHEPLPGSGVERDAEAYNMRHKRRGAAVIFNHEKFSRMNVRNGTAKDAANLSDQLSALEFDVRVHNDLDYSTVKEVLRNTAKEDHSDADCLLVVVLSHGEPGILFARDMPYPVQEIWSWFTGDKCPQLAGKPKLFFLQACRGDQVDAGVRIADATDGYTMSYSIPTQADILVAYSTVEGFYSWRNPKKGSWFIQALCEELKTNGRRRDLLTLLTFVCRRVAIEYQSCVPDSNDMDNKKQTPFFTSTLTRLLHFPKPRAL